MARTKLTELARLSGGLRTGSLGDGRLGDCLDAADRQGEGVFASTTGIDEEDYREDPLDDQDGPEPSTGRKRFRTQKVLEAFESELVLSSWMDGTKLDLSRAFRRSDFPSDMFCIPSKYLKRAKKEYGDGSSPAAVGRRVKRSLKRPNKAVQQAIKDIPQAMALALADLLSTACFPDC